MAQLTHNHLKKLPYEMTSTIDAVAIINLLELFNADCSSYNLLIQQKRATR